MRTGRGLDVLSLGSFVVLGLPDGMLGTAWPSMRQSFGVPIADLGLILLVITAGSVAVSAFVGALIRRFGVPALLTASGSCAALGGIGFAVAPGIWLIFAVSALLGVAAGLMDGGLNTAIGLAGRPRLLNLLHAAYGVGTTIGPLLITAAILVSSWRPAYVALAVLDLVIAASWLRQQRAERARSGGPPPAGGAAPDVAPPHAAPAADHPAAATGHPSWSPRRSAFVVAAGMAIFFVYTGVEVAAGQWEASFCRGHLGLSAAAAGIATFGYWGALTGVRIILALLPRPVPPPAVVRWGSGIGAVAAAVIWWQPGTAVTLAGFVAARRRAGRRVPGPDRADTGPDRPRPGPARDRLAGRRGRGRRFRPVRAHRPADRGRWPGRPRAVPHRPGGPAGHRQRRARPRGARAYGERT